VIEEIRRAGARVPLEQPGRDHLARQYAFRLSRSKQALFPFGPRTHCDPTGFTARVRSELSLTASNQ
jgi:hypothetical protein